MNRIAFLLPLALLALVACSASDGDGDGGAVSCDRICDAAAACLEDEGEAQLTRAQCMTDCTGNVDDECLADMGAACLSCFEACDSSCVATACVCETGGNGQPGDPCEDDYDCEPGSICYNAAWCVGTGALRITLSFEVDSDYDLHVLTPNGNEIYYMNQTADTGMLDVDQCISSCGAGTHVENVVFAAPPSGSYQVWVENFDGRAGGAFAIEVAIDGDIQSYPGTLPAEGDAVSAPITFTVE